MKVATALGISLAALTVAAYATPATRVFVRHGGAMADIDANNDSWITRAEASAAFDRIFDDMDSNNDGRLTSDDRPAHFDIDIENLEGPGFDEENCTQTVEPANAETPRAGQRVERRITVICHGGDGARDERRVMLRVGDDLDEHELERIERDVERQVERAERDAERAERQAERAAEEAERHFERHVIVINGEHGDHPAAAPIAPTPPHPPMALMLLANTEEADTNGDGALSRDEFRTQHLRFFDASDVNGDGRVRFERLPEPPVAPEAPEPPQPPRRP